MTGQLTQLGGLLGARLEGIDFKTGLDAAALEAIAEGVHHFQVLSLPAADMTPEQHLAIAQHFGEPEEHATGYFQRIEGVPHITVIDSEAGDRADSWHADETFLPASPIMNFLHARQVPAYGGDTAFISTAAAYDALSPRMQSMLDGLTALHDLSRTYELGWQWGLPLAERIAETLREHKYHSHPVVRTHPVTGRRWIAVNPTYTRFIEGLPPLEGQALLEFLFRHMQRPEFAFRHRWREGDLLIWDQQAVQHYAVVDFSGRRVMHRISVLPRSAA